MQGTRGRTGRSTMSRLPAGGRRPVCRGRAREGRRSGRRGGQGEKDKACWRSCIAGGFAGGVRDGGRKREADGEGVAWLILSSRMTAKTSPNRTSCPPQARRDASRESSGHFRRVSMRGGRREVEEMVVEGEERTAEANWCSVMAAGPVIGVDASRHATAPVRRIRLP